MINNSKLVQLGKNGISVAEDAISSFKNSKANMSMPVATKRLDAAQISAARARRPVGAEKVDKMQLENAKSVAVSHGTPAENVLVKSIDYFA